MIAVSFIALNLSITVSITFDHVLVAFTKIWGETKNFFLIISVIGAVHQNPGFPRYLSFQNRQIWLVRNSRGFLQRWRFKHRATFWQSVYLLSRKVNCLQLSFLLFSQKVPIMKDILQQCRYYFNIWGSFENSSG